MESYNQIISFISACMTGLVCIICFLLAPLLQSPMKFFFRKFPSVVCSDLIRGNNVHSHSPSLSLALPSRTTRAFWHCRCTHSSDATFERFFLASPAIICFLPVVWEKSWADPFGFRRSSIELGGNYQPVNRKFSFTSHGVRFPAQLWILKLRRDSLDEISDPDSRRFQKKNHITSEYISSLFFASDYVMYSELHTLL